MYVLCIYMYMKIHVYSTLAKSVEEEERKEHPDPLQDTRTNHHENKHIDTQ